MSAPAISAMIEAAMAARRASIGGRDIEIVVTELGLVVRGILITDRQSFVASNEVEWEEFEIRPHLLVNSVNLVLDKLIKPQRGES